MFGWGRRRRAREREHLERACGNVWQIACLEEDSRELLLSYALEVLEGTSFEVAGGLQLEDEMRATIALHVALLGHRLPPSRRPTRLRIILYPDYFSDPDRLSMSVRMGEVGEFGAMALAWRSVLLGGLDPDAVNVVIHELAHVLDGLTGDVDGMPLLSNDEARERWRRILDDELDDHRLIHARRRPALVSEYATTNAAEFFAEGATYFVQDGPGLEEERPRLFGLLREYFGFDPVPWTPPSTKELDPRVEALEADRIEFEIQACRRLLDASPESADANYQLAALLLASDEYDEGLSLYERAFDLGLDGADYVANRAQYMMVARRFEDAEREFSRVLEELPRWVEVRCDRARLRRWVGDRDGARRDLDEALRLDPESDLALAERGLLALDEEAWDDALQAFDEALGVHPDAVLALAGRAHAYEALGDPSRAAEDRQAAADMGVDEPDLETFLKESRRPPERPTAEGSGTA